MASASRQPTPDLIAAILAEAPAFSFFQVVRLLEQHCGGAALGGTRAAAEPIRLRPSPELSFPLASVERVEEVKSPTDQPRYRVTVNFLGLYGTTSPLPNFFTEDVLFYDGEHDSARDLLDLVNHRLLALFYRAWAKYRYHVRWQAGGADEVSAKVFAFCGLADPAVRDRIGVPAVRLLRYAGLLTQNPHSAASLRGILADYFDGVPTAVQQCVLRWVWIDDADQWRLGRRNGALGRTSTIGLRVPDRAGKFRVAFGPMDLATYLTFLPQGSRSTAAAALTRMVARDHLTFDLEARLRHEEIPLPELAPENPPQLGWTSWLGRGKSGDDGAVVFRVRTETTGQVPGGAAS